MARTEKDARLIEYKDTISQLNMTIKSQNEIKKLFGTSSEKTQTPEGQYSFFDEAEQEAIPNDEAEAAESIPVKGHTRKAKSRQPDIFKGVPSRDEIIPLSDEQRHCADCGAELEVIGKEFIRKEFRFTPAKGEVVNIYVETAKCPVCSEAPAMAKAIQFVKSHAPEALIPHSYATASVAAGVIYQKYADSMPLYRQEQDWN